MLDAAESWDRDRRDPSYLFSGSRLLRVVEWQRASSTGVEYLPPVATEFIARSWQRQEEETRERERLEREAREAEQRRLREQAEAAG